MRIAVGLSGHYVTICVDVSGAVSHLVFDFVGVLVDDGVFVAVFVACRISKLW